MPTGSALDGLAVVDYSGNLIGARASQLLADYGADVIVVEPPGGCVVRESPGAPFLLRNKKSIELDLKDPADAAVARDLAVSADVVIETWRPGVAERLGLGYESLHADNPRLVYGSVTGFGRTGALAGIKGYEGVVMAKIGKFGGLRLADRDGPSFGTAPTACFSASHTLLHGLLAALYERESSGVGQRVDTSMLLAMTTQDCWNWLMRTVAARYPEAYVAVPRVDERRKVPNGRTGFRHLVSSTKDGRWLQFAADTDRLFFSMLDALGLGWTLDDPEWRDASNSTDVDVRDRLWVRMLDAVRQRTLQEWTDFFDVQPNVFAEVFRRGTELLDHPQLLHDQRVVEVDDPKLGRVRQLAELVRMDRTPAVAYLPAPALDEHGAELRRSARAGERDDRRDAGEHAAVARAEPPLSGVTIVELGSYYAGPYGATLLVELGARVIKIEPLDGDPIRFLLGFPETTGVKPLSGKESVALDITTADGRGIVRQLIARADGALLTFRAGVVERLGLDVQTLLSINPDLVCLSAPGYGVDGPFGSRPTFAPAIAAGSGVAGRNLGAVMADGPVRDIDELKRRALLVSVATVGQTNSDGIAAVGVATGLLLGLLADRRGAPGQALLTSMLFTNGHLLGDDLIEYTGRAPSADVDPDFCGLDPLYRLYPGADGWVFLAAAASGEWEVLIAALGPDAGALARDARFATPEERERHADLLVSELTEVFGARTAAEWEVRLTARDVACVEVAPGPSDATIMQGDDALAAQIDHLVDLEHPVLGPYRRLKPLVTFSRSTGSVSGAPLLGAHTDGVLSELGYDQPAIAGLRERGVVR